MMRPGERPAIQRVGQSLPIGPAGVCTAGARPAVEEPMASISPPPAGGSFADYLAARGLGRRSVPGERSEAVKAEELWRSGAVAAAELADAMAAFYRLPRLSFQDVAACPAAIGDLSSRFLRETAAFPFERQDEVWLAVADAGRDEAIAAIRLALGRAAPLAVVSFEDIDLLFERAAADTGAVVIADDEAAADAVDMSDSVETLQDLEHLEAGARVEIAGGLVGEQHPRVVDQRPGDGDPLLFTAA